MVAPHWPEPDVRIHAAKRRIAGQVRVGENLGVQTFALPARRRRRRRQRQLALLPCPSVPALDAIVHRVLTVVGAPKYLALGGLQNQALLRIVCPGGRRLAGLVQLAPFEGGISRFLLLGEMTERAGI